MVCHILDICWVLHFFTMYEADSAFFMRGFARFVNGIIRTVHYICLYLRLVTMFNLILFGPPGSGKGTQSEKLIARYGFKHLSTGDILRNEIKNGTALGLEAKGLMEQGKLVPDAVVVGMIRSALEQNPDAKGFLFDGFPRTNAQAEALDDLLQEIHSPIQVLLALQVSKS